MIHIDGKIRIQRLSAWNIRITIVVAALFAVLSALGNHEFHVLQEATERYFLCEDAANQLQAGSDYLTEQVRLYAMTGERQYMDNYFEEANVTRRRENALELLRADFDGTEAFQALHEALVYSDHLMDTEYYSMRLVSEANGIALSSWPKEVAAVSPTPADRVSTKEEKLSKAQMLVFSDQYQKARTSIRTDVSQCLEALVAATRDQQSRAATIFSDMYLKLELGVGLLAALMLAMCMMVRHSIVKPLMSYNESIQRGEIFPVIGAAELQTLAVTYNKVYRENQETQMLIRHEAEHDALTDLLNRGPDPGGRGHLQACERHLRPCRRRPDPEKGGQAPADHLPEHRLCVPDRRRRVRRHHGGDDQRPGLYDPGEDRLYQRGALRGHGRSGGGLPQRGHRLLRPGGAQ